jgi:hypothetical protein
MTVKQWMSKPGTDVDGIAKTEVDHHMRCPGCGEWFDMRDLDQVAMHIHDGDFEIGEASTDLP